MNCNYCNRRMRPNSLRGYYCKHCGTWYANCRERREYDLPEQEIIKKNTTKTDIIFITIALLLTILISIFIFNKK